MVRKNGNVKFDEKIIGVDNLIMTEIKREITTLKKNTKLKEIQLKKIQKQIEYGSLSFFKNYFKQDKDLYNKYVKYLKEEQNYNIVKRFNIVGWKCPTLIS